MEQHFGFTTLQTPELDVYRDPSNELNYNCFKAYL